MQTKRQAVPMRNYLPNFITTLRIIGTVCLLFVKPFSAIFYAIYTFSGITDVLDGWLARKLKVASEFGAKLDSISDLLFYAVMLIKVFPTLWKKLPMGIWYTVSIILVLRVISYATAAARYHCFASIHTYMNKMTGAAVFSVPYIIQTPVAVVLCAIVCVIALAATVEELMIHICSKKYNGNHKTLMSVIKEQ